MRQNWYLKSLVLVFVLALVLQSATAQVVGTSSAAPVITGQTATLQFALSSPESVDAINGTLVYDNVLLTNPSVQAAGGSPGFTAEGNQTAPGIYRFILYKNPPDSPLALNQAVLNFTFNTAGGLIGTPVANVYFENAAAARILDTPANSVVSIAIGGPGGAPPAKSVYFTAAQITITGTPQIVQGPRNQSVRVGQNVNFNVGARGLGEPFGYQWFNVGGSMDGSTAQLLSLTNVQETDAGPYRVDVTNLAGTTSSGSATLTVLNDADAHNDASLLGTSVPPSVAPSQSFSIGVLMRNTGNLSWSAAQGYGLGRAGDDDANLLQGVGRFYITGEQTVVAASGGGTYQFLVQLRSPDSTGDFSVQLRMDEEGRGFFGDVASINLHVVTPPNLTRDWLNFE